MPVRHRPSALHVPGREVGGHVLPGPDRRRRQRGRVHGRGGEGHSGQDHSGADHRREAEGQPRRVLGELRVRGRHPPEGGHGPANRSGSQSVSLPHLAGDHLRRQVQRRLQREPRSGVAGGGHHQHSEEVGQQQPGFGHRRTYASIRQLRCMYGNERENEGGNNVMTEEITYISWITKTLLCFCLLVWHFLFQKENK
ncbi:hypothetical protein BHE74_00047513 [Ensete ventricosum]|nr:hypothetical protein GW17_00007169 [Ensete ventricosum]RWW46567.1 hypothetical protein BHE74_00047513 [Ensete ventricosum]RZS12672.1 hypothetical protein BHM03_00044155 [Ensete ventricosum]